MSKSDPQDQGNCRCSNCGYIHWHEKPPKPGQAEEPIPAPKEVVPVIPDVPQDIRCPLCGCEFTDAEVYTAHREADCQYPSVDSGLPDSPDPLDLSTIPVAPIVDPADVTTIAPEPAPAPAPAEDPNAS
jgi:rubredoxin